MVIARQQVEAEIHHTLLKYDGLVESAATNQGAWLTESAGALSDLHTAVLRSLGGFSVCSPEVNGEAASTLLEDAAVPAGVEEGSSGGQYVSTRKGDTTTSEGPAYRQGGDKGACAEYHGVSAGVDGGAAHHDGAPCTADGVRDAAKSQDSTTPTTATTTSATDRGKTSLDKRRDPRRARLQYLGLLLARKRQFTASRQVCM